MHREPDVGFDPGSPGSRPGPKAGAKPLRHPGIPENYSTLFGLSGTYKETSLNWLAQQQSINIQHLNTQF